MTSPGGVEVAQTRAWQEAVDSLVKAMPATVPAQHVAEQFLKWVGEEFDLRLKLSETLAERDRARDEAALLESEVADLRAKVDAVRAQAVSRGPRGSLSAPAVLAALGGAGPDTEETNQ